MNFQVLNPGQIYEKQAFYLLYYLSRPLKSFYEPKVILKPLFLLCNAQLNNDLKNENLMRIYHSQNKPRSKVRLFNVIGIVIYSAIYFPFGCDYLLSLSNMKVAANILFK